MNRRTFDCMTYVGLVCSFYAVCDMLMRWEVPGTYYLYLIVGVVNAASVAMILLSSKARARFQELTRGGSRLLWLRLVLMILVFVLGWYVNAAMTALHGADSAMVQDNGIRMFAVVFTLVLHVFYFGYTKKKS